VAKLRRQIYPHYSRKQSSNFLARLMLRFWTTYALAAMYNYFGATPLHPAKRSKPRQQSRLQLVDPQYNARNWPESRAWAGRWSVERPKSITARIFERIESHKKSRNADDWLVRSRSLFQKSAASPFARCVRPGKPISSANRLVFFTSLTVWTSTERMSAFTTNCPKRGHAGAPASGTVGEVNRPSRELFVRRGDVRSAEFIPPQRLLVPQCIIASFICAFRGVLRTEVRAPFVARAWIGQVGHVPPGSLG